MKLQLHFVPSACARNPHSPNFVSAEKNLEWNKQTNLFSAKEYAIQINEREATQTEVTTAFSSSDLKSVTKILRIRYVHKYRDSEESEIPKVREIDTTRRSTISPLGTNP